MKKLIAVLFAGALAGTFPLFSSRAEAPQLVNYQGRLLDGTNLVNGNVGMSLRLFNVPGGGSSLYEDSNTVTVVDGAYSTFIGDNPTNSSFLSALTNAAVYVEVAINGVALTPRERLASVGYSLATRGISVDATTTNVGIGTGTPTNKLQVAGTVQATSFIGDGSQLTGIASGGGSATPPPGMVLIPGGTFAIGDSLDGLSDAPVTNVTVSAYYMDINLVTLSRWKSIHYWAVAHSYIFSHAGSGKAANHPVQTVDWYDCVKWCNALSQQVGLNPVYYTDAAFTAVYKSGQVAPYVNWTNSGYRLPTEAEWERAARGGIAGQRFPWGNTISQNLANYTGYTSSGYDDGPNGYNAAFTNGFAPYTGPVGYFAPNTYGLYDMAGNVEQWCWDWWSSPTNTGSAYRGGTDPHGSTNGIYRILRGGSYDDISPVLRCAFRNNYFVDSGDFKFGFRTVRKP